MHDQTLSAWHSSQCCSLGKISCLSVNSSKFCQYLSRLELPPNLQCVGAVELSWQPLGYTAHAALWPDKVSRRFWCVSCSLSLISAYPAHSKRHPQDSIRSEHRFDRGFIQVSHHFVNFDSIHDVHALALTPSMSNHFSVQLILDELRPSTCKSTTLLITKFWFTCIYAAGPALITCTAGFTC